jgi:acyl-CoA dehydrogenase
MSDGEDIRSLVVDSATRIFRDFCDPQTINSARDLSWKEPLWRELTENGLALSWVPEENGGAGVGVGAGFAILNISGQFAVPVPLAETMLAGWLLAQGGIEIPEGPMSIAPVSLRDARSIASDGTLSGATRNIPFAMDVEHFAVLAEGDAGLVAALVNASDCTVEPTQTIAGDPQGHVTLDGVKAVAQARVPDADTANILMLMGATARSVQMAGAMQAVLDMTVNYAQERIAFGRPIGKFQAVQHNLARLAGEMAAATAVSGSAADTIEHADGFDGAVFLEAASAKIRVGEAAGEVAAIAHQVFGAIGYTDEHILHRYVRRLWAWRDEFGTESEWAEMLGQQVAAIGADELWPMLTAR